MMGPFRTLDEVVESLGRLEQEFVSRRDRRAVFLTVYGLMTREMKRQVDDGAFEDPGWVTRYAVGFADRYRQALEGHEQGTRIAKAWQLAFDVAREPSGLVLQNMLLGINAHVNHDLALALVDASIDPDRVSRHADHTAVNGVLRALTDVVSERVSELYAQGLAGLDACSGLLDEAVTNFSFEVARENAWESAVALTNARFEVERVAVRRLLDLRAAAIARLILVPNRRPELTAACRKIEDGGWWRVLESVHAGVPLS
jgi:hypothetical protein